MGCDFPLKAYRTETILPSGKRAISFNPLDAVNSTSPMEIPCNNCMGCKLERSRQWAVRMNHEAKLWPQNCFITLTYSDETVPTNYGLDLRHLQLFFKKLRKSLPHKIRFFACGEYGDLKGRPHYHAIIFNHQFPDLKPHSQINNNPHYSSQILTDLWQHGLTLTTHFSFQAAAYVARYVTKKLKTTNNEYGAEKYFRQSPIDGNYYNVKPEFAVMSRKPGLGHGYVEKYKSDYYPSGFIVVNGVKQAPPRYYVSKLSEEEQTKLKRAARRKSLIFKPHTTTERRLARAAVRDDRISRLKRNIE